MAAETFRSRLKAGERLLGTMITLPNASTAEVLADIGWDWFFLDGEHGPLESNQLLNIMQAVSHKVPCVVRVPSGDAVSIKKALDLGAEGIIAPQINTANQAMNVVEACKYSPEGSRGVGLARAHGYGFGFQEYVETANDRVAVIVQAEHADAVENISNIVAVEGIDAVLLGPYDLAASLGKMGQVDDPTVIEAIEHVTNTCQSAGIPLGYFGITSDAVQPYADRGYTLLVAGVDVLFLGTAARKMYRALSPTD